MEPNCSRLCWPAMSMPDPCLEHGLEVAVALLRGHEEFLVVGEVTDPVAEHEVVLHAVIARVGDVGHAGLEEHDRRLAGQALRVRFHHRPEFAKALRGERGQECLTGLEVPVGCRRRHAGLARESAQAEALRTLRLDVPHRGVEQGLAEIAVVIAAVVGSTHGASSSPARRLSDRLRGQSRRVIECYRSTREKC
jgi:hypothetical protein